MTHVSGALEAGCNFNHLNFRGSPSFTSSIFAGFTKFGRLSFQPKRKPKQLPTAHGLAVGNHPGRSNTEQTSGTSMGRAPQPLVQLLLLSLAATGAGVGAVGIDSSSSTCTTRGGGREHPSRSCTPAVEQGARPSFAKSWVSRARGGGGSRVTAGGGDGGGGAPKGGDGGKPGAHDQDIELALLGNFPNRWVLQACRPLNALLGRLYCCCQDGSQHSMRSASPLFVAA